MRLLVTGGAGFIGSNFIRYMLQTHPDCFVVNYDLLTYAGNLNNVADLEPKANYKFVKGDIADKDKVDLVIRENKITHIVNFAAETHVDRSIYSSGQFVRTNVLGTEVLLEVALENKIERFHHISTDEVYGSLALKSEKKFDLRTKYEPRSPYSASKASSDHLVASFYHTYKLPVTISNCSNNYGPFQNPEKFIPRAITNLILGKKIPIYGDGKYVRDWLYVEDHCRAIDLILSKGKVGETYLIGGLTEDVSNIQIAKKLLKVFQRGNDYIDTVPDRLGHDRKYAVDWSKTKSELGWEPMRDFDTWLSQTISWYQENEWWWKPLKTESERFYKHQKQRKDIENFTGFIKNTPIPGLLEIEMPTYKDNRGFFREVMRLNVLNSLLNSKFRFKQWNHSFSKPGVIRALHAENWNKLIYPITGDMFAAIADIRPESPTFGKVVTFQFSESMYKAIFIPKGLANSICVNGDKPVHYIYLTDAYYNGSDTKAIIWNDPDLAINWPIKKPLISDRDKSNPRLRDLFPDKF